MLVFWKIVRTYSMDDPKSLYVYPSKHGKNLWFSNLFRGCTLTDDFWGLRKNMKCAFPLTYFSLVLHFL